MFKKRLTVGQTDIQQGETMERLIGTMTIISLGIFLLGGRTQGILITKKDAQIDSQPTVEWQLGNQVEVAEWVALQKQVCGDLNYATATLPDQARNDIYINIPAWKMIAWLWERLSIRCSQARWRRS
jgi:hypothetical protein